MPDLTAEQWQMSAMYQEGVFTIRMGTFFVHGLIGVDRARLITAAPKMLAALERIEPHLGQGYAAVPGETLGEIARSAIAEARGGISSDRHPKTPPENTPNMVSGAMLPLFKR